MLSQDQHMNALAKQASVRIVAMIRVLICDCLSRLHACCMLGLLRCGHMSGRGRLIRQI